MLDGPGEGEGAAEIVRNQIYWRLDSGKFEDLRNKQRHAVERRLKSLRHLGTAEARKIRRQTAAVAAREPAISSHSHRCIDDVRKPEGALERSPKAGESAPSGVDANRPKRFSVQRKMAIVARLLRGQPLELVARETEVSVAKLTEWRERALAGAASALKERERDERDDEIARLKSKVGEITMDNELLYAKIAAMEGKRPLARRRPRR